MEASRIEELRTTGHGYTFSNGDNEPSRVITQKEMNAILDALAASGAARAEAERERDELNARVPAIEREADAIRMQREAEQERDQALAARAEAVAAITREEHFCSGAHAVRWLAIKGCTTCNLVAVEEERDQARSDLAAARESAKSMNRRCQEAESKAAATRESVRAELLAESESRAPGRPMGRMLANFTIEQLRSDLAAMTKERDNLKTECLGWREGAKRAND